MLNERSVVARPVFTSHGRHIDHGEYMHCMILTNINPLLMILNGASLLFVGCLCSRELIQYSDLYFTYMCAQMIYDAFLFGAVMHAAGSKAGEVS